MKRILLVASILLSLPLSAQKVQPADKARAAELVSQMTLDEKIAFLGGSSDGFHINGIPRLGIPEIRMADGPQGVRNDTRSTLYACGVAAAATWNPDLVGEMGKALGLDARARGVHILLGPGVNICRSPLCGRNFEYYGEDPFLASTTAVAYIRGVQQQGVMASVKHFALNNEEYDRHHHNSVADERTMHEIYFPAFRAAVEKAGVATVMTSYNLVNGVHASENPYLIGETLRGRWGFEGFTMSDWTSTYSPVGVVQNGVDLEMPHGFCMNKETLLPLLEKGVITEQQLSDKACRILENLIAYGFLDRPQKDESIPEDNAYSRDVALRLARECLVLLKNDGILPLGKRQKVALTGPMTDVIPCGGGSGSVDALHSVSVRDGLSSLGIRVVGEDKAAAIVVAVGFDSSNEKENSDRTFGLPEGQDEIVEKALATGKPVIVIVNAGGAVDVSRWIDKVSALIWAWYPGQEGGLAIAELLYGRYSPSGRLPVSFPAKLEDNPSQPWYTPMPAPTKRGYSVQQITYGEGVFMGYRGYGDVKPLFPFGFGLSYTTFEYSGLVVVKTPDGGCDVTVNVRNTGRKDGAETVQVYLGEVNPAVPRPYYELKGFKKVFLRKGEAESVTIHLDADAFEYFDSARLDWARGEGPFRIGVGSNSADIICETVL